MNTHILTKIENQVKEILDKLPLKLKEEIRVEVQRKIQDQFTYIRDNFSAATYDSCMRIIQEEYFMPGQVIVDHGDCQTQKLYLIAKGEGTFLFNTKMIILLLLAIFFKFNFNH